MLLRLEVMSSWLCMKLCLAKLTMNNELNSHFFFLLCFSRDVHIWVLPRVGRLLLGRVQPVRCLC